MHIHNLFGNTLICLELVKLVLLTTLPLIQLMVLCWKVCGILQYGLHKEDFNGNRCKSLTL
jgi:hypothetical protein